MECVSTAICDRPRVRGMRRLGPILPVLVGAWLLAGTGTLHAEEAAAQPAPAAATQPDTGKKAKVSVKLKFDARKAARVVLLDIPWAWPVGALSVATLMADAVVWANRADDCCGVKQLPFTVQPWAWRLWQVGLLGAGLSLGALAILLFVLPEVAPLRRLIIGEPPKDS